MEFAMKMSGPSETQRTQFITITPATSVLIWMIKMADQSKPVDPILTLEAEKHEFAHGKKILDG
jgi:hypothetical protein